MKQDARIFVAGRFGMVGSAIDRRLRALGYANIVGPPSSELDLQDQHAVADFFRGERPEYVFLAAARVGGIHANNTYPADFIYNNLQIQMNVIHSCWKNGVRKLLFLGSSCIYPKHAPQPIREEHLLTGLLEPTNEPYAVAKIAGIKMCEAYNRQHGTNFISVMPTNLYGPNDSYDPMNSHVLPALIRRFHEAKVAAAPEVVVWGTGEPRREFMYVDDLADACVYLMQTYDGPGIVNIGTGQEVRIADLAALVREVVGYKGVLRFDPTKPDGTPRKLLDCSFLHAMGWRHQTELREGIARAYEDFQRTGGRSHSGDRIALPRVG
ncbi:MAG: GDP-L-fucose synthase [Candidatus Sumerlaeia bacterium]|nr:GDP-L-fucose synthase [Candidatus Sumerlaeia bacterium]